MASDRKIDMVILGLLSHENLTGYDIKKRIDGGISFFWKGSFGSIYPSLSAMEKDGRIKKLPISNREGGREKIWYSITESGRESLLEWIQTEKVSNDLKYETLLKVFFGNCGNKDDIIKAIDDFENDALRNLQVLNVFKGRLEPILSEEDHKYYYLTVLFGISTYEAQIKWCKEARDILVGTQ